jgi:N6-adenosine-specific RNA methylase IME4
VVSIAVDTQERGVQTKGGAPAQCYDPQRRYEVVYSDPPWSYYGAQDKWGAAAKFYRTAGLTDLARLAKPPLADPGVFFLWVPSAHLGHALSLIEYHWALSYRGVAFVWVKTKGNGTPIGAQGVRPSVTKPLTEFVLAASTMARGRPLPIADEGICQTVFAPKREHSRKPDEVRKRIELLYPRASKLEMFSRVQTPGWDVHGDEITKYPVST